ncbi:6-carboxytetrahydropterin synthase [Streptomyces sp. XD-27]|uniref:6-pyruvoyl trahydropterin synthase family protein n=1 Tax=Streptomyces sp. XD-27 TaxID=3062779 RepID=UPI0026F4400F|nr:6-carboxytetrahydropterin synthase [Streptomyces sp. XD-27]WKX70378.1 6-carboxytetrahydropterin synthase [Streptomyces sp. XD-27]
MGRRDARPPAPERSGRGGYAPTAENLAKWIYDTWHDELPELSTVKVSETPKTWAVHRP